MIHDASGLCFWRGKYHHFERGRRFSSGKTTALLLRSEDLATWESRGIFLEDGYYSQPGDDCACPNFVPIGSGKHLLLYFSHKRGPQYYIGTSELETGRFEPEHFGRMKYGPVARGSLHAPSAFIDPDVRCIAIWNIIENRGTRTGWTTPMTGGWKELMSLPRHIALNEGNYLAPLRIEPVAELANLRFDPVKLDDLKLGANQERVLENVQGKAMEIEAVIDPMEAREVGLNVFRSPAGEEQTTVTVFMDGWPRNRHMRQLAIDVSRASLDPEVKARSPEIGPLYLEDGEPLQLRVFIDRSVVEVFAGGRQCLTLRTYPSREDSSGVSVFARGRDARLVSFRAWHEPLLHELGIPPALLPEHVPCCTPLGPVIEARRLSLAPEAMVYSALGDNQAGIAAVLQPDTPEAVINVGTSSQLSVPLSACSLASTLHSSRERPLRSGNCST
jgi:beta-fructofuranosidase